MEHAQKRKEASGSEKTRFGTQVTFPGQVAQRDKEVKAARGNLIRRFRPGSEENEAMLRLRTQERRDEVGLLAETAPRSSVLKYGLGTAPPELRAGLTNPPPLPLATKLQPISRPYHPRERDILTIVTGPVDYNKLLDDQEITAKELSAKDKEYTDLIDTYDRIQYRIQRKYVIFSPPHEVCLETRQK